MMLVVGAKGGSGEQVAAPPPTPREGFREPDGLAFVTRFRDGPMIFRTTYWTDDTDRVVQVALAVLHDDWEQVWETHRVVRGDSDHAEALDEVWERWRRYAGTWGVAERLL